MAAHHPDKTVGVTSLCVPYLSTGFTLEDLRAAGRPYSLSRGAVPGRAVGLPVLPTRGFDKACASFDANPRNLVKALFRKGDPSRVGKPAPTSDDAQGAAAGSAAAPAPTYRAMPMC